jgi:hypothetical protein
MVAKYPNDSIMIKSAGLREGLCPDDRPGPDYARKAWSCGKKNASTASSKEAPTTPRKRRNSICKRGFSRTNRRCHVREAEAYPQIGKNLD